MPSVSASLGIDDVRRVLERVDVVDDPHSLPSTAVTHVGDGVNDVFVVDPPDQGAARFVLKVGTLSSAANLRGGVAAARVLRAYTSLPVPHVLAFDPGDGEQPPAVATTYCDGTPLASGFDDVENFTDPAAVSLVGETVDALDAIPPEAAVGYGSVRAVESVDDDPQLVATHDDFDDWLVGYASKHFESPAPHPALERVAPDALEYLESNRDRLPSDPSPSVVLTDFSPGNLLAPDGRPPASVDDLSGLIDLERAKIGPATFAAVNLEYLLTNELDDPTPVQEALYDELSFGPDLPLRDLYWLVALSRPVSGLATWENPESPEFDRRARAVARSIDALVD
ncbi:aminoglycoside phosphotransferase family protein [Halorubellus sp. JP-L1]|uniref:phosphotransferase family protein n=1 Tax=Halorubellus sp. JP-L1 TaxID=2715753 RepID=UPI00140CB445|nr:phosphotransferase [Halorubellus sp. JP-L1]NHN40377.1 aminoglycoside phosphotransferase family protein [Halorubellus sp. JP-L1]